MNLNDRLRVWWDRVRGHADGVASPAVRTRPPAVTRAIAPAAASADGELKLNVAGTGQDSHAPTAQPGQQVGAGFDPYSSDGGYAKPHAWETIDRK